MKHYQSAKNYMDTHDKVALKNRVASTSQDDCNKYLTLFFKTEKFKYIIKNNPESL